MNINVNGPKNSIDLPWFGGIIITETVLVQWIVMLIIMIAVFILTSNLKKYPSKKQVIAEELVKFVNNMVRENMGPHNITYAPYIAALFLFILLGSLISMIGLRSMTGDINVTAALAFMTFMIITYKKFKSNGFLGYFKSYTEPNPVITPINIISEVATPVSMAIRLFANIAAGSIITAMIYAALSLASTAIGLPEKLPLLSVGLPALLSIYFDLFTGVIQSYVFIMLTMAFSSNAEAAD